jgi:sodium transport system permease protein
MNWKHVQLIFMREMVDQLRDRRTIFTITILPLLLYPLLGMLMMQVVQFHRESPVRVAVLGNENWPSEFPLLDAEGQLKIDGVSQAQRELVLFQPKSWPTGNQNVDALARQYLAEGAVDAVLIVKPSFSYDLASQPEDRDEAIPSQANDVKNTQGSGDEGSPATTPREPASNDFPLNSIESGKSLALYTNMARDQSSIANTRVSRLLDQWWDQWRTRELIQGGMAPNLSAPFTLAQVDTSASSVRQAVRWSKVLPFVMLVWALTGAFYPAVDLCAGEKERGTLETLLTSPARRREIVWGKLLTINAFSIGSALLNLISMQLTAGLVVKSLTGGSGEVAQSMGPFPIHSLGWLLLLLIPMSAFFSALALAVAALAKSTKEGQYYLMPLLLVTLPLVGLPMIPSMEMNLGTCLIPVSGAVFLVRSLIEGRFQEAAVHLPIVLLVTIGCCWLAIRWAVKQFESESVMFNEGGRWDLRIWLKHLWRDRQDTAQPSIAIACGVLILVIKFFAQFLISPSMSQTAMLLLVQLGMILLPCVVMASLLTRNPRRALRIHRFQFSHVLAAAMFGVALHPSYHVLAEAIQYVYPIAPETQRMLAEFETTGLKNGLLSLIVMMAVLPAICEELVFRGFIFGGLMRQQGLVRAIVVSAILFGFTHAILQQCIAASVMGLVLGVIAWRTGGVVCTILVHAISNALTITVAWCSKRNLAVPDWLDWIFSAGPDGWSYKPIWHYMSIVLAIALTMIIFHRSRQTERSVLAEMA